MIRENYTSPEFMLASYPDMDKRHIIDAMREHTGIKIIEAVDLLTKDFPKEQKDQLMAKIDLVIDSIL
jgi:hypothetical protein